MHKCNVLLNKKIKNKFQNFLFHNQHIDITGSCMASLLIITIISLLCTVSPLRWHSWNSLILRCPAASFEPPGYLDTQHDDALGSLGQIFLEWNVCQEMFYIGYYYLPINNISFLLTFLGTVLKLKICNHLIEIWRLCSSLKYHSISLSLTRHWTVQNCI